MSEIPDTCSLLDLPVHTSARITTVTGGQGAYRQLLDLGLRLGTELVRQPQEEEGYGSLRIAAHGKDIVIGRGLAEKVAVDTRESAVQTTLYDLISGIFVNVQPAADPFIERLHLALHGGYQQVVPAWKVAVDGGAGHAGRRGHLFHPGPGETVGQVTAAGGADDRVDRIGFVINHGRNSP